MLLLVEHALTRLKPKSATAKAAAQTSSHLPVIPLFSVEPQRITQYLLAV